MADAGRLAKRRDGFEMLPRQDFGRRHHRGLPAGLDGPRHGEQADQRLAAADIAMQQPQHPARRRHVVQDLAQRDLLRARQLEGQGAGDFRRQPPVADDGAPAGPAEPPPQQGQRQLPGKQLVAGQPHPGRGVEIDVALVGGTMQRLQRVGEGGPAAPLDQPPVEPFRHLRQPRQRSA